MANSVITNKERNIMLNRTYTENGDLSSTEYLAPTQFQIGLSQTAPTVATTALDVGIPIEDGTVCDDGSNTMTGYFGGSNSTDNTTTYKEGAGQSDVTAQNLITNATSTTKTWEIGDLSSAGTNAVGTKPYGLWLYIKDATTFAKLAGTPLQVRLGSDISGGNYYKQVFQKTDLAVGWNWITSGTTNVEDLTEIGTVGSPIDEFRILLITNNAADAFIAGDVIYDLLRQWATTDLHKTYVSGYPTFDYTTNEVSIRCLLDSLEANGFPIDGLATNNEDTSELLCTAAQMTDESKTSTDEFVYIIKNRIL